MSVPFVDLMAQQAEVAEEVLPQWQRLFAAARFVGGEEVESFERDFASFTGARHCVGVANGTDALELALRAVGVERGGQGDRAVRLLAVLQHRHEGAPDGEA